MECYAEAKNWKDLQVRAGLLIQDQETSVNYLGGMSTLAALAQLTLLKTKNKKTFLWFSGMPYDGTQWTDQIKYIFSSCC
jgi:hypothetical protein